MLNRNQKYFDNSKDVQWNVPAFGLFNRINIDKLGSFQNYQIDWFDALTGEFIIAQGRNTGIDGRIVLEYPKLSMIEEEQPVLAFRLYKQGENWFDQEENRVMLVETIDTQKIIKPINVEIFPNPATEGFYIKIEDTFEQVKISLLNLDGKIILSQNSANRSTFIDTRSIAPGIYIVKISTSFDTIYKKLIVQ